MKKNRLLYWIVGPLMTLGACDSFLDTMPDNRAEIDTESKVTSLLVSAYPGNTPILMTEMSSDNAKDNGSKNAVEDQVQEEAYLWQDITGSGNDSPKNFWDGCYGAIAAANHALAAIDEMGNPANLKAQRGEALLCRAYGHFALANVFCLAYNPQTASKDMGIPYSDAPETAVSPNYERGTMADLYAKIDADLTEGMPLINDEIYSVPKYHFNRKAAYAFGARFYLYYHKYDKAIECANVVLGSSPEKILRDWSAIYSSASNWGVRVDMYISASEPANLLLLPVTSSWGYFGGPYTLGKRYGHAKGIFTKESVRAKGVWGNAYSSNALYPAFSVWGIDEKLVVSKIGGYFQYTDKVNGIGYRKNVITAFTTDETLLCRAEAYALQGNLENATADINSWLYTHTANHIKRTTEDISTIYGGMDYMPLEITNDNQRTPKKTLHPQGFTVAAGDQENVIQCILHMRRVETVHEGLRWQDIKRYGIEIAHNRDGQSDDVLKADDPRRAIQLPQDVINAGLKANPRH